MVTPRDLLALAERLAVANAEAERRAAISRAYYAAFHHCREIVEERIGLPDFGTADDHGRVADGLWAVDIEAAQAFVLLRRRRNLADYSLDATVTMLGAQAACAIATGLLTLA